VKNKKFFFLIFSYFQGKKKKKGHFQKYPLFAVISLVLYLAVKNMFISANSYVSITFIHAN